MKAAEEFFYDTWKSPPSAALNNFQFIGTGLFLEKKRSRMDISEGMRMLPSFKAFKDHQTLFW